MPSEVIGGEAMWAALQASAAGHPPDWWADLESAALSEEAAFLHRTLAPVAEPGPTVVAQLGQTLDGRIATDDGAAQVISGPEGLSHLHRLRALVDVVVIGRRTATLDDPRLTVRHVPGRSPARAVIDPSGRCPREARLFANDGSRRLLLTEEARQAPPGVEVLVVRPDQDGGLDPHALRHALREAGLPRILVEGGGVTVSRFLAAGALDRLHLCVSPMLLGSGRAGVTLPAVDGLEGALRPSGRWTSVGEDVLFDLGFGEA